VAQARKFDLNTVKEFAQQCSNWGKWGPEDELGTINYIALVLQKRGGSNGD